MVICTNCLCKANGVEPELADFFSVGPDDTLGFGGQEAKLRILHRYLNNSEENKYLKFLEFLSF